VFVVFFQELDTCCFKFLDFDGVEKCFKLPFADEIPAFRFGGLPEATVELLKVEVLFVVQCVGVRSIYILLGCVVYIKKY
jgi:hypothetical protein